MAGWGGMVLVGILAVVFVAIPDIKSLKDIWMIPVAFFVTLGFSGFVFQPVFNFLTWSLYTSKVGEPILHRMRMYK
jgi:hypothetical protein